MIRSKTRKRTRKKIRKKTSRKTRMKTRKKSRKKTRIRMRRMKRTMTKSPTKRTMSSHLKSLMKNPTSMSCLHQRAKLSKVPLRKQPEQWSIWYVLNWKVLARAWVKALSNTTDQSSNSNEQTYLLMST